MTDELKQRAKEEMARLGSEKYSDYLEAIKAEFDVDESSFIRMSLARRMAARLFFSDAMWVGLMDKVRETAEQKGISEQQAAAEIASGTTMLKRLEDADEQMENAYLRLRQDMHRPHQTPITRREPRGSERRAPRGVA